MQILCILGIGEILQDLRGWECLLLKFNGLQVRTFYNIDLGSSTEVTLKGYGLFGKESIDILRDGDELDIKVLEVCLAYNSFDCHFLKTRIFYWHEGIMTALCFCPKLGFTLVG